MVQIFTNYLFSLSQVNHTRRNDLLHQHPLTQRIEVDGSVGEVFLAQSTWLNQNKMTGKYN